MPADPSIIEERLVVVADTMAKLIGSSTYLQGVPVATERIGDINATIRDALAKLGLSIVVVAADADTLQRKGTTLQLRVRLVAQVSELVLINQGATGRRKPALACAVAVMKAVDRQPNGLDPEGVMHRPGLNEFTLDDDQPFRLTKDPRCVVYQVTAHTLVDL